MEADASPNIQAAKSPQGDKKAKLWAILMREKVGPELVLSPEHMRTINAELQANKFYVYNTLATLEREGRIIRKKDNKHKGVTIVFQPYKNPNTEDKEVKSDRKLSRDTTFGEALAILDREIKTLEDFLAGKKALRSQIQEIIKRGNE